MPLPCVGQWGSGRKHEKTEHVKKSTQSVWQCWIFWQIKITVKQRNISYVSFCQNQTEEIRFILMRHWTIVSHKLGGQRRAAAKWLLITALCLHHHSPTNTHAGIQTHTHTHTHTHTYNNENIISSSPCGSLLHNQRWLNWILSCLLEHDYTPKDPQLNITQMNSHFPATIDNWTQRAASQKTVLKRCRLIFLS